MQAKRVVESNEPGRHLNVEDVLRDPPGVLNAQGEILLPGVDHGFDLRISHQLPNRCQIQCEKRIDQRHGLLRR